MEPRPCFALEMMRLACCGLVERFAARHDQPPPEFEPARLNERLLGGGVASQEL